MMQTNFPKENIELGLAYNFRCLVLYYQVEKRGSIQLLEELRAVRLDLQAAGGDFIIV